MNTLQIPQTDSIEELARFWEEHDLTDFEGELEEVTEPVFVRSQQATVRIQLPWQQMERLKRLASDKGIGHAALVQEWVLEKLQAD